MFLTGPEIQRRIVDGEIVIYPFRPEAVGPNSVNLRLGSQLLVYRDPSRKPPGWPRRLSDALRRLLGRPRPQEALDMRLANAMTTLFIPAEGLVLQPGFLYLGHTIEHTETTDLVPCIEGRSSVGRLGLCVHVTAGFGETGFKGTWTLEMTVVHPLRVYAGVEVCQISYSTTLGEVVPYAGKYVGQTGPRESRLYKDFRTEKP